jgi:hypothetical protein
MQNHEIQKFLLDELSIIDIMMRAASENEEY